jgi:hypothetical protein
VQRSAAAARSEPSRSAFRQSLPVHQPIEIDPDPDTVRQEIE